MATYEELYTVWQNSGLRHKVAVAIAIAADTVRTDGTPPANQADRVVWARKVFSDPMSFVTPVMWALIAINKDASLANLLNATDAQIQAAVDAVVDHFSPGTLTAADNSAMIEKL